MDNAYLLIKNTVSYTAHEKELQRQQEIEDIIQDLDIEPTQYDEGWDG